MGHARGFYRPARNHRALHHLGAQSVDTLDSQPHGSFRRRFQHATGQDPLSPGPLLVLRRAF